MGDIVLQGADSSRCNLSHIAKKSWGKRLLSLFRKSRHDVAILPGDAILLPLVDSVTLNGSAVSPKHLSHFRSIAKRLDQVSVHMSHVGSVGIFFRVVNEDHSHDLKNVPSQNGEMVDERDEYAVECGERLRRTREALGFNKVRHFAKNHGVGESTYGKWELGVAMVPPWFVKRLFENHEINFDWIYGGDERRLPHETVVSLRRQS